MFTVSDKIETLRPSGIGRVEMQGPGFTASDKIEIFLRTARREEGRGHSRNRRRLFPARSAAARFGDTRLRRAASDPCGGACRAWHHGDADRG